MEKAMISIIDAFKSQNIYLKRYITRYPACAATDLSRRFFCHLCFTLL